MDRARRPTLAGPPPVLRLHSRFDPNPISFQSFFHNLENFFFAAAPSLRDAKHSYFHGQLLPGPYG